MPRKHTTQESRDKRLKEIEKLLKDKSLSSEERRRLGSERGGLRGAGSLQRRMAAIRGNKIRHGKEW